VVKAAPVAVTISSRRVKPTLAYRLSFAGLLDSR
jgi:hypothetical protein